MRAPETHSDLKTVLVFKSRAFNTTERRSHFVNDGCYGDDVARWFIERLRALGFDTDEQPGQEDFGWYVGYRTADGRYSLVLGYRPDEPMGDWICWVERDGGLLVSLFGGRERKIARSAVDAIRAAIEHESGLSDVRWYTRTSFDAGELDPSPTP